MYKFRDDKKAFAQDHKARLIVNDAVYAGYLETMNESQRLFMLLPLIHSEEITDHDMAYYLLNKYLIEQGNSFIVTKEVTLSELHMKYKNIKCYARIEGNINV